MDPDLVRRLKKTVRSLTEVLDDAEEREIRDDVRVDFWLDRVQKSVFDAEALLDEIEYDALRQKGESETLGTHTTIKIYKILDRLKELKKLKKLLDLVYNSWKEKPWRKPPSTDLGRQESNFFGRDAEKEALIGLLLSESERTRMIPIVGMGGVGKTVLAQVVYNNSRVKDHFDLRLWVWVSQEFDLNEVTRSLLFSATFPLPPPPRGAFDLETLQNKLRDSLAGKKFLIVLDDVWNYKPEHWRFMRDLFDNGAHGSRIVVTTRSHEVARLILSPFSATSSDDSDDQTSTKRDTPPMWTDQARATSETDFLTKQDGYGRREFNQQDIFLRMVHPIDIDQVTVSSETDYLGDDIIHLSVLDEDASWKLFSLRAFNNKLNRCFETEEIARKIVQKCKGLPLAVMTYAYLSRKQFDIDQWYILLATEISDLPVNLSDVFHSLKLSYYSLSLPVKKCFAYFAVLPKHNSFERDELISLWMSQGLLEQPQENMRMEDIGDRYFDELISKSLIEPSNGSKTHFVIHNLVIDIAIAISGKYYYRQGTSISDDLVWTEAVRHLLRFDDLGRLSEKFYWDFKAVNMRSFIAVRVPSEEVRKLLGKVKYLRTFSFSENPSSSEEFIASVFEHKFLRYLKLCVASMTKLPNSLCSMFNLQTLKLARCDSLCELPEDVHRLVSLRYLDISFTALESLPDSFCKLSTLQTLILKGSKLRTLPDNMDGLVQLRHLDASSTELYILPASIAKLHDLQKLHLRNCLKLCILPDGLDQLAQLRYLDVNFTGIVSLPSRLRRMSDSRR